MKSNISIVAALLAVIACGVGVAKAGEDTQIARGKYLANHVAMCVQCHSPRDERGILIETQLFHGAPIPLRSPYRNVEWAVRAPVIAGLPGWRGEDVVTLLMTGHRPTGESPRPPMPPFRLSRPDATAIVAYLKSLVPTP
jgi:mono/diheme cytochrome c family protein